MVDLNAYLTLASLLFGIGAIGFLVRRNALIQLMSIELMLNSVNIVLVAVNRLHVDNHVGQIFSFFVIAIAAAEAAVGLAILIALFRLHKSVDTDTADTLKH
jgi:NADH-quinone oxidoreductase subunit K